ncbi:immunity protein TriTu family protein [Actinoplanes sp. NPDC004185]
MMELDLDDFTTAVATRGLQWQAAGVQWQLHHGPTRSKSSAWVDCTTARHLARLIVWTSGEADLEVGDISTGAVTITHYQMSDAAELDVCLEDLTNQINARG